MSRYGVARPLSGWPSAVFSLLPPFAAPPLRGGWCPGWGAAPPGGLGLDTREPPRSTLRKSPRREESPQRARGRPSDLAHRGGQRPRLGGSPGRLGKPSHAQALAGRWRRRWRWVPHPAVPRTGATAAEASRVPAVPGAAWREAPARWQAAVQAWEE